MAGTQLKVSLWADSQETCNDEREYEGVEI